MSRTPPTRPYPRTISSPDCADPPVRRRPGRFYRPNGAIERAQEPSVVGGSLRERLAAIAPALAGHVAAVGFDHSSAWPRTAPAPPSRTRPRSSGSGPGRTGADAEAHPARGPADLLGLHCRREHRGGPSGRGPRPCKVEPSGTDDAGAIRATNSGATVRCQRWVTTPVFGEPDRPTPGGRGRGGRKVHPAGLQPRRCHRP